jgi:hypothetical protein
LPRDTQRADGNSVLSQSPTGKIPPPMELSDFGFASQSTFCRISPCVRNP